VVVVVVGVVVVVVVVAYHHISKTVEASRVHLFDIVTQYRAIFTDDDLLLTSPAADDRPNDSLLFHGWVVQKVKINRVATLLENLGNLEK